jgi:H+/Cl- antiporter ClcA
VLHNTVKWLFSLKHQVQSRPMFQKYSKWAFFILLTSLIVGTASAFFLWSLDQITQLRNDQPWLLFFLPVIGAVIALLYSKFDSKLKNGNVFIIQSYFNNEAAVKNDSIPFILTPLVFIGTLLSHLGGGSVGREGTAVQMGASIACQLNRWFSLDKSEQRLLTCIGISAGFSAVFGTPLAASIFALELFGFKKTKWFFLIPTLLSAYFAHYVCIGWGIQHAHYEIISFNDYTYQTIGWISFSGILFGLAALLFIRSSILFSTVFSKIKTHYFRPIIGAVVFVALVYFTHQEKMTGLGLQIISDAFVHQQGSFDFLIKILLTSFILSSGFKGGEVTPLFFIGAVLGSALITFIPLPISLLAGLGLIAVFAGATHCVLTAILLGIELFGIEYAFYIIIVCVIAYLISGSKNIYEGRPLGKIKERWSPYFL